MTCQVFGAFCVFYVVFDKSESNLTLVYPVYELPILICRLIRHRLPCLLCLPAGAVRSGLQAANYFPQVIIEIFR